MRIKQGISGIRIDTSCNMFRILKCHDKILALNELRAIAIRKNTHAYIVDKDNFIWDKKAGTFLEDPK